MMILISDLLVDAAGTVQGPEAAAAARARRDGVSRPGRRRARFSLQRPDAVRRPGIAGPLELQSAGTARRLSGGVEQLPGGVRRGCARDAVDYALIRTSQPLDAALAAFLSRRDATRRGRRTDMTTPRKVIYSPQRKSRVPTASMAWAMTDPTRMPCPSRRVIPLPIAALGRPAAGGVAAGDPFDQPDAASARRVGGDGVSAGKPEAQQKWIMLKQLLLLLLRTVAIAAGRADVAQPVVRSGWAGLFGRGKTHHLVLLDDSFSMSDHWADTSAFDQAKRVVVRVLDQARGNTTTSNSSRCCGSPMPPSRGRRGSRSSTGGRSNAEVSRRTWNGFSASWSPPKPPPGRSRPWKPRRGCRSRPRAKRGSRISSPTSAARNGRSRRSFGTV